MGRKALAIIVGLITAVAIIWIAYMIGTKAAPNTPNNLEYLSQENIAAYMNNFTTTAFVTVAIGYAAAAFAGGFISTKMGRRWSSGSTLALTLGVLLSIGSIITYFIWPQPIWFVLLSLVIFVPISLFGYKLASHAV